MIRRMTPDFDIRRIEVIDDQMAELYRRMTPGQRMQIGSNMHEFSVRIMEGGIRSCHPDWDAKQIRQEVLRRLECSQSNGS
jgi:hypothetical protein